MRFRKDARLDTSQVDDRRGRRGAGGAPMAMGGGGLALVVVVLALLFGVDPFGGADPLGGALGGLAGQQVGASSGPSEVERECRTGQDANERQDCRLVAVVNSVQAYWSKALRGYEPAATVFFSGSTATACGAATSAVGPFYCPADRTVYVDLGFFEQLQSDFGASGGPLAEAYVLAHEYGHHVQNLTGVLRSADRDTGPQGGQVRVELQADCYAGVWIANAVRTGLVEDLTRQDLSDALEAAAAVGDDRIQERTQGRVTPEAWTHGSAEQRQRWAGRGSESGSPRSCDTFRARV